MSVKFEEMGIAALLPGMQYVLDKVQEELSRMRDLLAQSQNGSSGVMEVPKKSSNKAKSTGSGNWWGKMTAEERSIEMRRRMKVRLRNQAKKRQDEESLNGRA